MTDRTQNVFNEALPLLDFLCIARPDESDRLAQVDWKDSPAHGKAQELSQ